VNSENPVSEKIGEGEKVDDWVRRRLEDMGLSEDDIGSVVEGGAGLHDNAWRWRLCPVCKSNIDMMITVEGEQDGVSWPRILPTGTVECPNCGTNGSRFGKLAENQPHPKLKTYQARAMHNPYPWVTKYVALGSAVIEELGLFPSDPSFDANEPHWPRDLGACLVGAAIVVASTIKKQTDRFDPAKAKNGAGRGRKDKKWGRRRGRGDGGVESNGDYRHR